MSVKETLLPTKCIFATNALKCATVQWNFISRTCNNPWHWKNTKTRSFL